MTDLYKKLVKPITDFTADNNLFPVMVLTILYAYAVGLVEAAEEKQQVSFDVFWKAICTVESNGNPRAFNKKENAKGIAQIRPIMIEDINRITESDIFKHEHAYRENLSKTMFKIYVTHYWPNGTYEQWAKSWNFGPTGPSNPKAEKYWIKVQKVMQKEK